MSDALGAAIRAVTKGLECDIVPGGWVSDDYCESHSVDVHDGECALIADMRRAVTVGFKAGRRDALSEIDVSTIAQSLVTSYGSHINAPKGGRDWRAAEDLLSVLRALLSTSEEARP